jgi:hypothetical protein
MARYLHTFVPGTEVSKPDVGAAASTVPAAAPAASFAPSPFAR